MVFMSQCPFLSTMEEKVICYKECALYEYEGSGDGCPFKRLKSRKVINIKDIITIDYTYDGDEDKTLIERIYSKNHYMDEFA